MKSLKTGQYKTTQSPQVQFVKASFSNFFFKNFLNLRNIVKPGGKKRDIQNHGGTNIMGSISSLVISSGIKEQIPEPEDIDRYKINLILYKSRKDQKKQIRK